MEASEIRIHQRVGHYIYTCNIVRIPCLSAITNEIGRIPYIGLYMNLCIYSYITGIYA